MKVTGQLVAPALQPCSCTGNAAARVDDACRPIQPKREVDWTGYDCCDYYKKDNTWCKDVVRVDHIDPEKFKYDKFRYQLYAKPAGHICNPEAVQQASEDRTRQLQQTAGRYIPATTDVRALEQSMYIPIVPSNPGGETEVTFPMTPRTMGHPDVTSACCVPVIPSQPGYKGLTPSIHPPSCPNLNSVRGVPPGSVNCPCMPRREGPGPTCAPHTHLPPSNTPGGAFLGLPDALPRTVQSYNWNPDALPVSGGSGGQLCGYARGMAQAQTLQPPHYTGAMGQPGHAPGMSGCAAGGSSMCHSRDDVYDGMPSRMQCVNTKTIRYPDRVQRDIAANAETQDEWASRMRTIYGSFGSYLVAPSHKRHLTGPKSSLFEQGNGFHFPYPKHTNRQCYVLERNARC